MRSTLLAAVAVCLVGAGCASDGDDPTTVATTSVSPTTSAADTTTSHTSTAVVTIDEETWEFDASCAQPSEGEVFVWGSGQVPDHDQPSELLLEASAATPYVGITGGGRLIEAAVDGPLVLVIESGAITGDDISFVADADIDTGVGTAVGTGTVRVECSRYVELTSPAAGDPPARAPSAESSTSIG